MVNIRRPKNEHRVGRGGISSSSSSKSSLSVAGIIHSYFRIFLIIIIIGQSIHLLLKLITNSKTTNNNNNGLRQQQQQVEQQPQYTKPRIRTDEEIFSMNITKTTTNQQQQHQHHKSLENEISEHVIPDRISNIVVEEKTKEEEEEHRNNHNEFNEEEEGYHEHHPDHMNDNNDNNEDEEDNNNNNNSAGKDEDSNKDHHVMKNSQPNINNNIIIKDHATLETIMKEGKDEDSNKDHHVMKNSQPNINNNIMIKDHDTFETIMKEGTGPGKLGYVVDLVQERMNETFRTTMNNRIDQKYFDTVQLKVEQIILNSNHEAEQEDEEVIVDIDHHMISCQSIIHHDNNGKTSLVQHMECHGNDNTDNDDNRNMKFKYYAYNPAPFPRILPCSSTGDAGDNEKKTTTIIPPGGVIGLDGHHDILNKCLNQPAYLFSPNKKYQHPETILKEEDGEDEDNNESYIIVTNKPVKKMEELQHDASYELQNVGTCDVPCKFSKSILMGDDDNSNNKNMIETITKQQQELYIAGTDWKVIRTMQDPYNYITAKVERTAFRENIYYSTTSFTSSVPLSFYSFDQYNLHNTKQLIWSDTPNKATYLIDTDCSGFRRNKWYAATQSVIPVESYGSCHHNTDLAPNNEETINTPSGRIQLLKKNRIALIFDTGGEKDYITTQIWESLLSGSIPAIHSASNAVKHLPRSSNNNPTAIYTSDFNSWDKFAEYVKIVAENQTLWDTYHTWRTDNVALEEFTKKYNFTKISADCRLCRWAYSKKYGLGWNHQQQIITETYIPHQICKNKNNDQLVSHPFREVWITTSSSETAATAIVQQQPPPTIHDKNNQHCHSSMTDSKRETIEVEDENDTDSGTTSITRRLFYHDGVSDIYIDKINKVDDDNVIILRLQLNVRNTEGAYFRNTHTLVSPSTIRGSFMSSISVQDEHVKITVLANFETTIHSPMAGYIDITISNKNEKDDPEMTNQEQYVKVLKRIRIITEDINPLHDKMTEFYPSHFGKIMMMDFIDPLEFFYSPKVQHNEDVAHEER